MISEYTRKGVSWRDYHLESVDWVRRSPSPVWAGITNLLRDIYKYNKREKEGHVCSLLELGHPFFSAFRHGAPGSQFFGSNRDWLHCPHPNIHTHTSWAFGLGLGLRPLAPLVHRPLDLDWIMPPTLVFLQLMDSKSWDFWLSNILLVLFRWRTLTNMPYSPVYLIHTFYPHIIIYVALFYFQKYPGLGNKVFPDLGTITMHWFYSLQFLYEAKLITCPKTCLNFYFL